MRLWPKEYVKWRLETAYPGGWKYAIKHPIQLLVDGWFFLKWCEKIDFVLLERGKKDC